MANIPLSEIPNAPAVMGAVMTKTPGANTDLSGVAQTLIAGTIPQGAFDGPAKGLQSIGKGAKDLGQGLEKLGEAGWKVQAVRDHWKAANGRAQDFASNILATKIMEDAVAQAAVELQGQPESAVGPMVQKVGAVTWKQISSFAFTPAGLEHAKQQHERMMARAHPIVTTKVQAAQIESAATTAKERYESLASEGDYEAAEQLLTGAVQVGLVAASTAESMRLAVMIEREHRKANDAIENDPWTEQERFAEAERTGASDGYTLMTKNDFGNLRIKAAQAIPVRLREVSDAIDQQMLGGQLRSEEDIREWAAVARLPEEEVTSLYAGLRNVPIETPEQRASYFKAQSDLMTALDTFDSENDVDGKGRAQIKQTIREKLPMAERGAWLEMLAKQESGKRDPQSQRRGGISQQVDLIMSQSVRGVDDPQKQAEVWQRARTLKNEAARFVREHPELTNEEAVAWVHGRLGDTIITNAARPLRSTP